MKNPCLFAMFSAVLGGCLMPGPHVPSDLAGNVPLRVANRTSDSICVLIAQPFAETQGRADNWLGTSLRQKPIAAGQEREFRIKPGSYRLAVASCNGVWGAGTRQGKLDIQAATYVAIGGKAEAPASYRLAYLPTVPLAQAAAGGGEAASEPEPAGDTAAPAGEGESGGEAASASSSSESQPAEPAQPSCLPTGTTTDNYHKCCSESFQTNGSDQDKDIYVCG